MRLHEIDAELVREAIAPLVGETAIAQVLPASNAILLAGPGDRLRRLADVMQRPRRDRVRRLILVPLRYADAETAAALLVEAVDDRGRELEVWPDARTNRLLVRGGPEAIERRARSCPASIARRWGRAGSRWCRSATWIPSGWPRCCARWSAQEVTPGAGGGASLAGRPFAVSVHAPTHSLVVQTDADTMGIVNDLVAELDHPPARVNVEVTVIELGHRGSLDLAVDAVLPFTDPEDRTTWSAVVDLRSRRQRAGFPGRGIAGRGHRRGAAVHAGRPLADRDPAARSAAADRDPARDRRADAGRAARCTRAS